MTDVLVSSILTTSAGSGAVLSTPSSKPEYDPSVPGSGSQRAISIMQLYVRLTNCYPLTITVVDALCFVFGAGGATVGELGSYLALSESAVEAALEGIPPDMHCTSADLEDAASPRIGNAKHVGRAAEDPYYEGSEEDDFLSGDHKGGKAALRHYLNFKRALSVAYAHVSHMLLALCTSPLPDSPYTEKIRRSQVDAVVHSVPATGAVAPDAEADSSAVASLLTTTLNISGSLRRKEALEGIYCPGCQFYFSLQDFKKTASRCPTCQQDILRSLVLSIKARLDSAYTQDGRSLVVAPGGAASARHANATAKESGETTRRERHSADTSDNALSRSAQRPPNASATEAKARGTDCPLARDPFLIQQALAFLFLYSAPFACLNDARCVVDPAEILTEPEYESRLKGKASVADEFRAHHRNPNRVRVKVVSQKHVDERLREDNTRKMAKRAHLPPWLQHSTTLASLNKRTGESGAVPANADGNSIFFTGAFNKAEDEAKDTAADGSAGGREGAPSADAQRHAKKRGRSEQTSSAAGGKTRLLLSQAQFVANEFFEDDYDVVPLPRYAKRSL